MKIPRYPGGVVLAGVVLLSGVLLGLEFWSTPARAQIDGPHIELAGGVGGAFFEQWLGIEDNLLLVGRAAYHPSALWGLEFQMDFVNSHQNIGETESTSRFYYLGLGGTFILTPMRGFSPYLSGSLGMASLILPHTTDRSLGAGLTAGMLLNLNRNVAAFAELKDDIASFQGSFTQQILVSIGLRFTFGTTEDLDGDGVSDSLDACPDTPLGAVVDENGCPSDLDGDGVFEGLDDCPDTPLRTPVDERGCPRR